MKRMRMQVLSAKRREKIAQEGRYSKGLSNENG